MFTLSINNTDYQFNFGMGFLKKIEKTAQVPVEGMPGIKQDQGLFLNMAKVYDGDVLALEDVLMLANEGFSPRLKREEFESFIEDEATDIDALFEIVLDFFRKANPTKKTMARLEKALNPDK